MTSDGEIPLSPRELDVVRLIVEGLTNAEICDALGISQRTVHAHVAAAMKKTQTTSRTQLAVHALRRRWVPLDADGLGTADPRTA